MTSTCPTCSHDSATTAQVTWAPVVARRADGSTYETGNQFTVTVMAYHQFQGQPGAPICPGTGKEVSREPIMPRKDLPEGHEYVEP